MNGQVLDFSIQTNSGTILGDDGNRYDFAGAEWRESDNPSRGMRVEFLAEGGNAVAVQRGPETLPGASGLSHFPGAAGSGDAGTNLHADPDLLPTYIVSRLLLGIGLLLVLTLLVFTLTRVAPGGDSAFTGAPVRGLILERLPVTLSLLPLTVVVAAVIAIPLGILAAALRGSWLDRLPGVAAAFGVAAPSFWVALILIWVFGLSLQWFPPYGGGGGMQYLFLPALVLGISSGAVMIGVIRSSIVEVLDRGAMGPPGPAIGPPVGACLARCLGNLLISGPALFGGFLAGAVVVETVFAVPGIGRLLMHSVYMRDFPVVWGVVMTAAVMLALVLGFSLVAGFVVRWLEPRAAARPVSDVPAHAGDTGLADATPAGAWRVPWPALVVLGILVLAALFAPVVAPHEPLQTSHLDRFLPPGDGHPLGTDQLGRDVLSQLIYGTRTGLGVALLALIPVAVVGGGLGLVSGWLGGRADAVITGAVDDVLSFPLLLVAILVMAALGSGSLSLAIAATLVLWPKVARATRDEVMALRTGGNLNPSSVFNAVMALLTLHIGLAILLEATLSFLGVGTPPPEPSWGSMLAASREHLPAAPWVALFPGLALTGVLVALLASPFRWWKI